MHSRKRSAAFLSDDTTNDTVAVAATPEHHTIPEDDTPSKRLQNNRGAPVPQSQPTIRYNAQRLLNNLAFVRLYVTANFHAWAPASSPVLLCLVDEQNDLCRALCHLLPSLYALCPHLQALAVTAGYVDPNATPDRALQRMLPLTTTAGLDGAVAEELEAFRRDLGPADCVAVVDAGGVCTWTSHEASSLGDLERGLVGAVGGGGGMGALMEE